MAAYFIPKTAQDVILNRNCVDHIDGNKTNNSVNNLRWCTNKENMNFDTAKEKAKAAGKNNKPKKVFCKNNNIIYKSISSAAKELSLSSGSISRVCRGLVQSTKDYKFEYYVEQ